MLFIFLILTFQIISGSKHFWDYFLFWIVKYISFLRTWFANVSASGAHVTVEPLATGVSTRLVCPSS